MHCSGVQYISVKGSVMQGFFSAFSELCSTTKCSAANPTRLHQFCQDPLKLIAPMCGVKQFSFFPCSCLTRVSREIWWWHLYEHFICEPAYKSPWTPLPPPSLTTFSKATSFVTFGALLCVLLPQYLDEKASLTWYLSQKSRIPVTMWTHLPKIMLIPPTFLGMPALLIRLHIMSSVWSVVLTCWHGNQRTLAISY